MAGPSHGVVEEPVKHAGDSQTSVLLPKVNLVPSTSFSIINKAALPTCAGVLRSHGQIRGSREGKSRSHLRGCPTIFPSGCTILHPPPQQ